MLTAPPWKDRKISIKERFLSKVNKTSTCWEWTAYRNPGGYGLVGFGTGVQAAHRVSYRLFIGEIPTGMHVCHTCDNRGCVNPEHLWIGTNTDNVNDKMRKGRFVTSRGDRNGTRTCPEKVAKGEAQGLSKLTTPEVLAIRSKYFHGTHKKSELARMYNVSQATIGHIIWRKTWKHLEQ